MENKINSLIELRQKNFSLLKNNSEDILKAVEIIKNALKNKNKILFCGNGGSASDSNHLACEFVSKFKKERTALAAISLASNNSIISAVANDFSFEDVFKRQIEALGQKGDVLIAISTSGKSKNILKAIEEANKQELKTIFLTGENKININTTLQINVPSKFTEQIQEIHIAIGHIIFELCEDEF